MIWLTWRQFRTQAVVAAAALAAVAAALAVTGPPLSHLYATSGLASCQVHGNCGPLAAVFLDQLKSRRTPYYAIFILGAVLLLLVPALIGMFWGAPLITREIETGTFRLAWNQSVTRTRWLAVKLGLVGMASMAAAGLLSLMLGWWSSPIERAIDLPGGRTGAATLNRFVPLLFATGGITPIGYAAFAFALGVTAGVLIRRTVPAMAVTLALFAVVQVVMPLWVRPYLMPPVHSTTALDAASIPTLNLTSTQMIITPAVSQPGAWVITNQAVTAQGQVFAGAPPQSCLSSTAPFSKCVAAINRLHLRQALVYQPASRYWPFQWYETVIFLALALALAGFCGWWIRRRRLC
jgi:hypothetical protein